MSLKYEIFGAQIDGARDYQEDSFLTSYLKDGSNVEDPVVLCIVSDGMGGHAAGHVASNLAVQAFNKHITANFQTYDVPALLVNAIDDANEAIAGTIKETDALKGMGCTLVAALCIKDKLHWVSVGDSHLFLIQDNVLKKMNDDHSYGGYIDRMAEEGNEVSEQNGYSRHMLLSALTGEPIPAVDCPDAPVTLKEGDRILLCSDGIDTLKPESVLDRSKKDEKPKQATENLLVEVTNARLPRQDNTTIVVLDLVNVAGKNKQKPVKIVKPMAPPVVPRSETVNTTNPTRYPKRPAETKTKGFPWLILLCLMAIIGACGWWYMDQNNLTINELLSGKEDSGFDTSDAIELPQQALPPIEISYFTDRLSNGRPGPQMVWIEAGSFEMGGKGTTPPANERPRHKVTFSKFAISSKEITRGEFAQYTGKAINSASRNLPARGISWNTAQKYVKWLSQQSGKRYRLPTEAEWEYAARARTSSPFWWGYTAGMNNAICIGCGDPFEPSSPASTGSLAANPYGLFDTAGNVSEWVEDCYYDNYDGAPDDGQARTNSGCKEHVIRGGSYINAAKSLYTSHREKLRANQSKMHVGLRVARDK